MNQLDEKWSVNTAHDAGSRKMRRQGTAAASQTEGREERMCLSSDWLIPGQVSGLSVAVRNQKTSHTAPRDPNT